VQSRRCYTVEDIHSALDEIPLPCIIKLDRGASAIGVKLVVSREECVEEFIRLRSELKEEADYPCAGLSYSDTTFVLVEYVFCLL